MFYRNKIYFAFIICLASVFFVGAFLFLEIKNRKASKHMAPPSSSVSKDEALPLYQEDNIPESSIIEKKNAPVMDAPKEINIDVPFTVQAPQANWDMPFQEACEEASVLMVDKFYKKQSFGNAKDTEKEIKAVIEFEEKKLGFTPDINAQEATQLIETYFKYDQVRVVYDITVEDIKKELSQGRPVIVPAAGRQLGNPNFRQPGPRYHMLVIKGYAGNKFITNDPGTRKGKDYLYDFEILHSAIHDWNGGEVEDGRKVMIVM